MHQAQRRRHWFALGSAVDGVSAVEFAVIASLLATLAIGTLDFGIYLLKQMEVGNAARAGAEYALANGFNSASISSAIQNATELSVSVNPAPTEFYGCPNTSSGITQVSQGTTCQSTSATAGTYVTSSAQLSYSTILTYPGISRPMTLSASATVRIQ